MLGWSLVLYICKTVLETKMKFNYVTSTVKVSTKIVSKFCATQLYIYLKKENKKKEIKREISAYSKHIIVCHLSVDMT